MAMVERLFDHLTLDGAEPFVVYYGDGVNDVFCGSNYICCSIEIALWRFLRQQDYQRIVFYDGARRLYCYDETSLQYCRPGATVSAATPVTVGTTGKMAGGPLGNRNLVREQRAGRSTPGLDDQAAAQPEQAGVTPPNPPRRGTSDTAALEILNYILIRDTAPLATALIFYHANDLDRQNLIGQTTFRELQNRMLHWAQALSPQPNICIFIFQEPTAEAVLETCQRQQLTVLNNFLARQKTLSGYVRHVSTPPAAEIQRLIHYCRLRHNLQVDWALLPEVVELLTQQKRSLKSWRARLTKTPCLTRDTLREWVQKDFIQVPEHRIEHLGARLQDVDPAILHEKLAPVVGQQEHTDLVVRKVCNWLTTPRKTKPLSLFLAGPSGVGKTQTVKLLAEALRDWGFADCAFQMNEYSEEHRISTLIGSPPGYTGFEEEPLLFQSLRRSPRLLVLFDEIEKAHRRILTNLMQLVDEGKLSTSRWAGDFRECVLCFTSNAMIGDMAAVRQAAQHSGQALDSATFQNRIRDVLVRADIAPEICGRINCFLVYNTLSLEATLQIATQQVHLLAASYELEVADISAEFLADTALASAGSPYGARPIQEQVNSLLQQHFIDWSKTCSRQRRIVVVNTENGDYGVTAAPPSVSAGPPHTRTGFDTALQICRQRQRRERLLDMDLLRTHLNQVYCQEDNIELLLRDLETWFAQARKEKPLSLFLAGPSGVGKTYTCKLLAEALQSRAYEMIVFRMSEYSDKSHVYNLIGSPAGHIGSDTPPKLFAARERNQRLVIVFDEIDKAHADILQALMQLLDEGMLGWSQGEADFRECVIAFTSNARRSEMVFLKTAFLNNGRTTGGVEFQNAVRDILTREGVAPEICGRINRFLVYNPLSPEAVFQIALTEMQRHAQRYELHLKSADPKFLADLALTSSGSPYGSRPISQWIQSHFGDIMLQYQKAHPVHQDVVLHQDVHGCRLIPAHEMPVPPRPELLNQAQMHYETLREAHSFVDADALHQALAQVRCQADNIQQLIARLEIWYSRRDKEAPLSLFLAGTSGVGKTYTAELLAGAMAPYGYHYKKINMTEYSDEASVNNLIGSSTGYIGSDETPPLFMALEESSRLVLLFDEIEKANPKVFMTLMQLLDKGLLSYSRGDGDFRECIILFTSNAAMKPIVDLKAAYHLQGRSTTGPEFQNDIRQILIAGYFPVEWCGRINCFLVYNPLSFEATVEIVLQEIEKLCAKQNCRLGGVAPVLLAEIARFTAGSPTGARAIRNEVENRLGQPLLEYRKRRQQHQPLYADLIGNAVHISPLADGHTGGEALQALEKTSK